MNGRLNVWIGVTMTAAVLRIWEPRSLRQGFDKLTVQVQSVGAVPFGRSITGALTALPPTISCAPVAPFISSSTIVILREGDCAWELQLLRVQEAGAALALLVQPQGEAIDYASDELLERIKIPSIVIEAAKAELLEQALSAHDLRGPVTLLVEFPQLETHQAAEIRFRATIDQAESYGALLLLQETLSSLHPPPRLSLTFKARTRSALLTDAQGNCTTGPGALCISSASQPPLPDLLNAAAAVLCLIDEAPQKLFEALRSMRNACFNTAGTPRSSFSLCLQKEATRGRDISPCLASETRKRELLTANLQEGSMGSDSPRVYIHGHLLRQSSLKKEGLLQAVCAGYSLPPRGCPHSSTLRLPTHTPIRQLIGFGFASVVLAVCCMGAVLWLLRLFYLRRVKRNFNGQLSERINTALEKYYGHSASHYSAAPTPP